MLYLKIGLLIIVGIWTFQLCLNPSQWIFLDYANLIFHEAGHFILFFTGSTLSLLAGTLMQLAIPLLCALYFLIHQQLFGVSFCLFWLGESLNNVSIYLRDANTMSLPLIGGHHDWNTLFTQYNLLDQANSIANSVQFLSTLIMLLGLCMMFALIFKTAILDHGHCQ